MTKDEKEKLGVMAEKICDTYCRIPELYASRYKDPDTAQHYLLDEICERCPICDLIEGNETKETDKMKYYIIPAQGEITAHLCDQIRLKALQRAVHGNIEIMKNDRFLVIGNEEGLIRGDKLNVLASILCKTYIFGDCVIAQQDGVELVGLDEWNEERLLEEIERVSNTNRNNIEVINEN